MSQLLPSWLYYLIYHVAGSISPIRDVVFFISGIGFDSGSFQIDHGNLPSHHHTQTLPLIKLKLPLASKLSQTNSFKCSSEIQSFFPQVLYILKLHWGSVSERSLSLHSCAQLCLHQYHTVLVTVTLQETWESGSVKVCNFDFFSFFIVVVKVT